MFSATKENGIARRSLLAEFLEVGERSMPLILVRNARARHYILRLNREGWARVTIPRGGSAAEALRFAQRHSDWLKRQFERLAANPPRRKEWLIGTEILLRGEFTVGRRRGSGRTCRRRFAPGH